jgi:hypothetical protein
MRAGEEFWGQELFRAADTPLQSGTPHLWPAVKWASSYLRQEVTSGALQAPLGAQVVTLHPCLFLLLPLISRMVASDLAHLQP